MISLKGKNKHSDGERQGIYYVSVLPYNEKEIKVYSIRHWELGIWR